jgi:hypothetical protein
MKRGLFPLRVGRWNLFLPVLILSAFGVWIPVQMRRAAPLEQRQLEGPSAAQFSRLIRDFSEEDGFFRSDNFTSNETSYLHVVGKLREMHISGGAYLGVGPEQNFTYIAKIRPQIAFIVDIRRQAMIQHLLYKALFRISENRADFLANLLSRPLAGGHAPNQRASLESLLQYFTSAPAPDQAFEANLARVSKTIRQQFQVPLSEHDHERLEYVYAAFRKEGLRISFRAGRTNWWGHSGAYPTLADLIVQPDLNGDPGNFLATDEDYRFVRRLQLQNRIIPIVGDFAGPKALAAVGEYLRKNGYTVSAFYTSNVEQFLFQNGEFGDFVRNVRGLPIDAGSVFIRAVPTRRWTHPAQVAGHRTTTILQKISVFLDDYDNGAFTDYWNLVTTHFIAGP